MSCQGKLSWEDTVEIVQLLRTQYPDVNLEDVSLGLIYHWTINLPEFDDEPELVNDDILLAIFQEWFEEVNNL